MPHLTQKELKENLHYDPETGIWTWIKPGHRRKLGQRAGRLKAKDNPYWIIGLNRKEYRSARLAFLYMTGSFPVNEADHIDRNSLNDAWGNLRDATRTEQQLNQKKRKRKNPQDDWLPKGVRRNGSGFCAELTIDYKLHYFGTYKTVQEAEIAFKNAYRTYR